MGQTGARSGDQGELALGSGLLIVWTDVAPAIEAEFHDWYNREHLPDRISRMPGFLRGRRYEKCADVRHAAADAPKFLTLYDLHSAAVMQSEAHTALRKNRSERDRYFVPQFRNTIKGICDVVCRAGRGGGDYLVLLPVVAEAGREQAFTRTVCEDWLLALDAVRDVTAVIYAPGNEIITAASSAKDDRAGDRYVSALMAIETQSVPAAATVLSYLDASRLCAAGGRAQWISSPCVLRRIFELRAA